MTCPICKAPSAGTKPCPGYCEGVEDGREHEWQESETGHTRCARCGCLRKLSVLRNFPHCPKMGAAERALLERDIAEVERHADELRLDARGHAWRAAVFAEEARFRAGIDPPLAPDEKPYLDGAAEAQRRAAHRYAEARRCRDTASDCEAWLVRAWAALGGGA